MIDTITKLVPLYLAPVLALTSTLLTLFAYLAPAQMLYTQVALMTISPGRSVPLPGDPKDNIDGPTVRMGPVGEQSFPASTWFDSDCAFQDRALNPPIPRPSIARRLRPPPFMVRIRPTTVAYWCSPYVFAFSQTSRCSREIHLHSCSPPRPPPLPGSPCRSYSGRCSSLYSACLLCANGLAGSSA